jgi:flagellar FliL protein
MAKPEQPKDIKPKTEGEGAAPKEKKPIDENMKVIIINLITTVLICVLFLSVNYVLQASLLSSKLSKLPAPAASDSDPSADNANDSESDASDVQKGFIVDLGDFILNLSDIAPRKYLKVNVALEVSSKPEDAAAAAPPAKKEGGEGAAPAGNPLDAEMAQYKPAIRDAVITTLSSKTSSEVSTVAGKELAKEQITEAVNGIFAGEREVLRVSFGEFIIQ